MKAKFMALLALCLILSGYLYADGSPALNGTVKDARNEPAIGALVSLLAAKDSSVVKSTLTDYDGNFQLDQMKTGAYLLRVSLVGHEAYTSATITLDTTVQNLPAITLQTSKGQELKEVSIVGQKAFIEQKIDRLVVNVDALISNAGSSALDALEKSPGVRIDNNGTISLKGKNGVMVFIDDKPTYLSGSELETYLRSLPADAVDKIEIMNNPPAKYEAAGNAGVINIKTKKAKANGFNGNVSLNYGQGRYASSNNSLNLNYRKNKLNFFTTLSYYGRTAFNDLDIIRDIRTQDEQPMTYFSQNSYIKFRSKSATSKLGMDFYATPKSTFGIVLTGQYTPGSRNTDNVSKIADAQRVPDSFIVAENRENSTFRNGGVNFNFRHNFDSSGRELGIDLDYVNYKTNDDVSFNNYSYRPDMSPLNQDHLTGNLPATINIYAAKIDYTHPLGKGAILSAGAKTSYTATDNTADYRNIVGDQAVPDYDKSNHFLYKEYINAGYLNLSKEWKRLSMQLGLRLEHTHSAGHQLGNAMKADSSFTRDYTNLFPTIYFSYKLDDNANNVIGLNYGRRIDRPYYENLNPFISPLDKFSYYVGNPFLNPSFSNTLTLTHTYKGKLTTTLSLGSIDNEVTETIELQGKIMYSRPGNIGSTRFGTLSVDAAIPVGKWLTVNAYGEFGYYHYKSQLYTETLDASGPYGFFSVNNQVLLGKGWSAELGAVYRTDVVSAQFISGTFWQVNTGLQKKLLQDKASIRLSLSDIFFTRVNKGIINNLAHADATYNNVYDTRIARLTFSYRFGKTNNQARQKNTSAEAEQGRVRQ